jgi:hypothetical protein
MLDVVRVTARARLICTSDSESQSIGPRPGQQATADAAAARQARAAGRLRAARGQRAAANPKGRARPLNGPETRRRPAAVGDQAGPGGRALPERPGPERAYHWQAASRRRSGAQAGNLNFK